MAHRLDKPPACLLHATSNLVISVLNWGKWNTLDIPEWIRYVPNSLPHYLIITSASESWSYKLTKFQISVIETTQYKNSWYGYCSSLVNAFDLHGQCRGFYAQSLHGGVGADPPVNHCLTLSMCNGYLAIGDDGDCGVLFLIRKDTKLHSYMLWNLVFMWVMLC